MPLELIIAFVAAIPPTVAATAAWRRSRGLEEPLEQVNTAVNHRKPGEPTLIQTVDSIAHTLTALNKAVNDVRADLETHRAWHQTQTEEDDTP